MKKKYNYKAILKYLSTIFSWAIFVILLSIAAFLLYYFVTVKIINRDNNNPPLSIYTIVSGSMIPTIDVYDVVINLKVDSPKDIEVGDIITFISEAPTTKGMTITHRVVDIQRVNGEYQFTTKGDNNIPTDSTPVVFEKVIGRAFMRIPQLGRVQAFVATKFGWLIVVILPALYIILKDVAKLIKISRLKKNAEIENNKMREKDDNYDYDDIIEDERNEEDERK